MTTLPILMRERILDQHLAQCGVRFYFGAALPTYEIATVHEPECGFEDQARICTCRALASKAVWA